MLTMQRTVPLELTASMSTSPTSSRIGDTPNSVNKPDRPCDACRRRKSRCVFNSDSSTCVLCDFHKQNCTFEEQPAPRKRKAPANETAVRLKRVYVTAEQTSSNHADLIRSSDTGQPPRRTSDSSIRTGPVIDDYANLQGESLLKKTLG
jgi:hypothetical protein